MLRRLLPVVLLLLGSAAGLGAGIALRPAAPGGDGGGHAADADHAAPAAETAQAAPAATAGHDGDPPLHAYVKLNNQFVVPIVAAGRVSALVVLSLSLEVGPDQTERVYALEPKLRDGLLQVMFDHANSGGFSGGFTEAGSLEPLRLALREAATRIFGPELTDVLIVDIVRQDN